MQQDRLNRFRSASPHANESHYASAAVFPFVSAAAIAMGSKTLLLRSNWKTSVVEDMQEDPDLKYFGFADNKLAGVRWQGRNRGPAGA